MDTKQLRQKILDLAIRGKLVPQDPNDEPASVLLERVKAEKERLIAEGKIKRSKKSATSSDKPHYAEWDLPSGWVWVRLDEIFEANPKNSNIDSDICGFVPMANVDDGFSGTHSYIERKWGEVKKGYCHFQNGDIAVAKISPCFENRKSTIFHSLPNNIGAGTTELVILRGHLVYAPYFLYLFKSQWYIGKGKVYFKGVVGQQRVNRDIFTSLEVPLPPLNEQRRIVSMIQRLFVVIDIVENNSCELKYNIEATKQRVLELGITGKLVPQDPADEPAADLLKRVNSNAVISTDTSHYIIPDNWVWVKMNDIFLINPKNQAADTLDCGFVSMASVEDGYSGKHTYEIRKWGNVKKGYCHFQNGDIGVAKISPCFENLKSVIFKTLPNNIGAGTTELVVLRGKEIFAPYFLYLFKSSWYISKGTVYFKGVVGQQRVSRDIFTTLEVPLPPLNEQKRIVAKVDELFAVIDQIKQSLE